MVDRAFYEHKSSGSIKSSNLGLAFKRNFKKNPPCLQVLNVSLCQQVSRTRPRATLLNTTNPGVSVGHPQSPALTCLCNFGLPSCFPGQTAGPGSQQTSSPDFNAWVDFYRQPMAYFNQGTPQTQAPSLQVRGNPLAFLPLGSHSCS